MEIELRTTDPQSVAYLGMTGDYSQIPLALGRLYEWLTGQGFDPAGMPGAAYFTPPSDDDVVPVWEVRVPIAGDAQPREADKGGFGVRTLPARLIAMAIHRGPYDTIERTYEELAAWIGENDYRMAGPPEESYLSDPEEVAPEDYETEIRLPVER